MQYTAPLRFKTKKIGSKFYSARIESPETRTIDDQPWRSTKRARKSEADAVAADWAVERLNQYVTPTPSPAAEAATPEAPALEPIPLNVSLAKLRNAFPKWSPSTVEIFELKSRQLVAHFGEAFDLRTTDRDKCEAYFVKRFKEDGVATGTIAKELGYFVRVVRDERALPHDAPDYWPRGLPKGTEQRDRALSVDEFKLLMGEMGPCHGYWREQPFGDAYGLRRRQWIEHAAPMGEDWRDHLKAYTLTGVRFSELYSWVPAEIRTTEHGTIWRVNGTKTKGARRDVSLSEDVVEMVQRRIRDGNLGPNDPIFPITSDTAQTDPREILRTQQNAWHRALQRACEACDIPHASTNDLRRTFATWCHARGVPEYICVGWMGHTSAKMVREVYRQATTEAQASAVALLPSFREGAPVVSITPMPKPTRLRVVGDDE
jgi:integrase